MLFTLDIETHPAERRAVLRLAEHEGAFLGAHEVILSDHAAADWHGVFDTRQHVRSLAAVTPAAVQLARLGTFLGEEVLGAEIARALAEGVEKRTLLVRVPADPEDTLAAAFARVPWEIAVAPGFEGTLGDRNVVVRAALSGSVVSEAEIAPGKKPVRVLLVFAEAPGQRPLAARLERERLLDLFFGEVMPGYDVEVDVLCHGVTRGRIREAVRARGGYHVVHWSGHGHVNLLQIGVDAGEKAEEHISGQELVGLFSGAGGFIPPVVFLSACHSGSMLAVKDWETLRASLGEDAGTKQGEPGLEKVLAEPSGFTGTALSLLRAGVKQVVAMRYEVGDVYARRLARRVYRGMFAEQAHHAVDGAVALARGELLGDARRDPKRAEEYSAVDHATPLVFGGEGVRFVPGKRRSGQVERRVPKPQPLLAGRELDKPHGFVGRGEELTRLLREWVEDEEQPVALIQGLAGMGKTSLAAEAIHLWFGRFDHVLAFQTKGTALSAEGMLQRVDQKLVVSSKAYRERCAEDELRKVWLAPGTEGFSAAAREEVCRNNLVDALGQERVLVVLDNFETNLIGKPGAEGEYACGDPAWERLLGELAERLKGTGSRVLVTSRHKPAALEDKALWLPLGPLEMREAALFFQGHAPLRELWFGDEEAFALAKRVLLVSRGHPLILGRIADLARSKYDKVHGLTPAGRVVIEEALDRIEGAGFESLPDLFAGLRSDKEREAERRYLEDVAVGAVDLLVERLTPGARTLLWVVTRVAEPPAEGMISAVWSGDSAEDEPTRELAQLLVMMESLPAEVRAQMPPIPEEIRAMVAALKDKRTIPPVAPLLGELCGAGLLVHDKEAYAFHELVAERAAAWMKEHPEERGGRTEVEVWKAYGERYGAAFNALLSSGKREAALEAGRRGIRYLVRARAFESLGGFASGVVTSTNDPSLLGPVIADLQAVAEEVPAGEARWSLRVCVADALDSAGRSEQALPFYALAVEEAEAAEHWLHVGTICQNWAGALGNAGQLNRARETSLRSAEARRRAGCPRVYVVTSEQEALRVDVLQGRAQEALPAIEEKLAEVRGWWARREKADTEDLARTLVSALDIAQQANLRLGRWQACLDILGEIEEVKRGLGASEHELARVRFNICGPLLRLGKLAEAKAVLEGCLDIFRRAEDVTREANALSALADVWSRLGDPHQALAVERCALALRDRLPDPGNRAISHYNLALYLHATGSPAEAGPHQLADLAYCLVTGLDPRGSLHNLAIRIREAAARGDRYDLPRLADLLATPTLAALRAFLTDRGVPIPNLQADIDARLPAVRAVAAASPPAT